MAAGALVFMAIIGLILLVARSLGAKAASRRRQGRGDSSHTASNPTDCGSGHCSDGDSGGDGGGGD